MNRAAIEHKAGPPKATEHKTTHGFLLKADASGVVESIVSVYGVLDLGNDIIWPGAFAKSIAERGGKIKVLDHHNTGSALDIVGKPLEIRELSAAELPAEVRARYPEATGGLYTRTQFLVETPEGKGIYDRIAAGALNEWSIGYDAVDSDYSIIKRDGKDVRVRNLRQNRLWEYSPVIWGMNEATATLSAKDAAGDEAKEIGEDGYPVQRMGDVLVALLCCEASETVNRWLLEGRLSLDEMTAAHAALNGATAALINALPIEIAGRQVYYYPDADADRWMYLARQAGAETKRPDPKAIAARVRAALAARGQKAGRMISNENGSAIMAAVESLVSVLTRAGIWADDEEDDDTEDSKGRPNAAGPDATPPTPKGAGPGADPPTDELALQLDIERELIATIGG